MRILFFEAVPSDPSYNSFPPLNYKCERTPSKSLVENISNLAKNPLEELQQLSLSESDSDESDFADDEQFRLRVRHTLKHRTEHCLNDPRKEAREASHKKIDQVRRDKKIGKSIALSKLLEKEPQDSFKPKVQHDRIELDPLEKSDYNEVIPPSYPEDELESDWEILLVDDYVETFPPKPRNSLTQDYDDESYVPDVRHSSNFRTKKPFDEPLKEAREASHKKIDQVRRDKKIGKSIARLDK